jgi:hypothetical protein
MDTKNVRTKSWLKTLNAVRAAQILFFLNAVIWLILGIVSLLRLSRGSPIPIIMALGIAIMMFGNASAMIVSGFGLRKWRGFYYLALAVLLVNIVLTFTDQVGLLDILTFALDLVLLGLLIVARKRFLHRDAQR